MGTLLYFAQFLNLGGCFDNLCNTAPLHPASNNAAPVRDVLGTALLAILSQHTRYAHIAALRNDPVCPALLGMGKTVSEDTVRRGLARICEAGLDAWLAPHAFATCMPLLHEPYVLDIDSSVKPIYGRQEGAEIGYNPKKPGRPSHVLHVCFIASLRLVLSVEVLPGGKHAGAHGAPGLWRTLDALPPEARPSLLRGDVSYGNESIMNEAEKRNQPYLFKLARHKTVQTAFRRMCAGPDAWRAAGDGWEGSETTLKLAGWTCSRRCLFLRRPRSKPAARPALTSGKQPELVFMRDVPVDPQWDYLCLVTNDTQFDAAGLSHLYRARADCENVFDEIKNQWGWSGFMTRDLARCNAMARLTALVYNWWNIFVRLANPETHLEAVTSRPLLLHAVGRLVRSGRQTFLRLTSNPSMSAKIQRVLGGIRAFFQRVGVLAEQWKPEQRWALLLSVAFRKFLKKPLPQLPPDIPHEVLLV